MDPLNQLVEAAITQVLIWNEICFCMIGWVSFSVDPDFCILVSFLYL